MVQNLLSDFHNKNTFINEIMHVFEPSSKFGQFSRNVPIRFSSPHHKVSIFKNRFIKQSNNNILIKELDNSNGSHSYSSLCTASTDMTLSPFDSPFSPKSQKICNDIILKTIFTGNISHNEKSSLGNILTDKKIRFVKRLKNRIETKTGRKLFSSTKQHNFDRIRINQIANDQLNSQYNLRRNLNMRSKRSLSIEPIKVDSCKNLSRHEEFKNHYENVESPQVYLQNQSLVIDTAVQPAYF